MDYLHEIRHIIEGKLKFIIYQQVLNELESKKIREPRATKFIRLLESGLSYLDKHKSDNDFNFLDDVKNSDETTDDFLLRKLTGLKKEGNILYLASNDSELRKKAREREINTIFLRKKKYLFIERV